MLNVLFPIVTAPYISRVLGVENVGTVRFVTIFVGYLVLLAAFGIGTYGVRELAKYKNDQEKCSRIFSSLFFITLCSTFVVTLLFILGINFIPELREYRLLFAIFGITLYLVPISMDWYFQAKENFRMIAIRSFVVRMLAIASLFIFVRERGDVVPYILISAFAIVVTHIWNFCYAYKGGLRIRLRHLELRRHIKAMFVFLWIGIAAGIYTMIDVVMLGFLSSHEQIGFYTSSNMIVLAVMGLFFAMNTVLLPRISFDNAQNGESNPMLLQKAFDLKVLLVVPMALGLCLIASRFVPLFFGGEFLGSIAPLQILSLKMIVMAISSFFAHNMLVAVGHEKKVLFAVIIASFISLVLSFLLIPHFGAIGSATVRVVVECFNLGLNLFFVYTLTKTRVQWKSIGTAVAFVLPFFAIYYLCAKFFPHNVVFLLVFVCLSSVVYFALQLWQKNYLVQQAVETVLIKLKNK